MSLFEVQSVEELKKMIVTINPADLTQQNAQKQTPIAYYASKGEWDKVEALLNPDNDIKDSQMFAEVIVLARKAKQDLLVQKLFDLVHPQTHWLIQNEEGNKDIAPLHLFIMRQKKEHIAILASTADLSLKGPGTATRRGYTAVRLASIYHDWETVKLLSKENTDELDTFQYGGAMLHAVHQKQYELAIALAKKGARLNYAIGCGEEGALNCFHIAVRKNHTVFLELLIAAQIRSSNQDVLEQKFRGHTPIEWAILCKHWHLIPLMAKMKPANPKAAGYVAAYKKAMKKADMFTPETLEALRIAAQVEKEGTPQKPVNKDTAKGSPPPAQKPNSDRLYEATQKLFLAAQEDAQLLSAFRKIYTALYNGQSSFLKSASFLDKHENITLKLIDGYCREKPASRTSKAMVLAQKYVKDMTNIELVKEIHQYAYEHSGFFKRSPNRAKLNSARAQEAYINANADSRTGQIRSALRQ
ncbi:Ankyrin repeats (3 copies) [Legionella birminghamensis]|uniref:Ankyrin repeats (3 copies) n=1 Tax=Legionella birminghamensis TaxID=28083 RepID=A0A378I7Q4_9GAMM|nr:ankyrin repeat domain-containing protein [Legionella birminghamensis]KTC72519.1 Ankyrin repeats (3 copies) [Legionella birminghamensis]STX30651.1 Ankyrin repeats (3 copies) [Legionella birminghamensis]